MATVSITDAAFAGFRLIRERPRVILIWAVLQLVVGLAFSVLTITVMGRALGQFQSMQGATSQDPTQALRALQGLAPLYALLFPYLIIFYGVAYAAMNRAVLRPKQEGLAYLRLGMAELRQMAVMILMGLLVMIVSLAAMLGVFLVGGALALIIGLAAKNAAVVLAPLFFALVVIGLIGATTFVVVRLSLASAQTFDTGRINLFGSWTLTRGHFWSMFAAYLLKNIMLFGMGLIYLLLYVAITFVLSGGSNGLLTMMRPDMSSLGAYFSAARIIPLILSSVFAAIYLPVSLTPSAAIYKGLTARFGVNADGEAATLDEVFS